MDTDKKIQDENITKGEQNTLHDAGVDLPGQTGAVSEAANEQAGFVDIDQAPVSNNDTDLKDIGLTFVEKSEKKAPSDTVTAPVGAAKPANDDKVSDLEQEFHKAVGDNPAKASPASLNEKISGLQAMLGKIKEKLGLKKTEVKAELESLKKVKEDIAEDIDLIKELEESEHKIEAELSKVETITGEIDSIEEEVEKELKS